MTILNAYLVPKYDEDNPEFGEGDGFFVGLQVVEFLNKAISAASVKELSMADFWWSQTGKVGPQGFKGA